MSQNLIIHNNRVVCPRCDGNGFLYQTILQPINIKSIMCDECEAIWPIDTQEFTNSNFQDFSTYIQQLGYTYTEIDVTNINYDWFLDKI